MVPDVTKYDWVNVYGPDDGGNYLFVKSRSVEDVLREFLVQPESLVERSMADILPIEPGVDVCYVAVMPDRTADWIAVGEHGSRFQSDDILRSISHGGMAIQCGFPWGSPRITIAVNGRVIRLIDTDHYDPADAVPEEGGLPFREAGPQSALMLIERITGIQMGPHWMLGPFVVAPAQLAS